MPKGDNILELAMRMSRVGKCCNKKELPQDPSSVCPFCYGDLSWIDGYKKRTDEV